MENFKLDSLNTWHPWDKEPISFGDPEGNPREITFKVNAAAYITIAALSVAVTKDSQGNEVRTETVTLLGAGQGLMTISFTTNKQVAVMWTAPPVQLAEGEIGLPAVFIQTRNVMWKTQTDGEAVSFTRIEPRGRRQSDSAAYMENMVRANEMRRMALLMADMERAKAARDEAVIEPTAPASPAPAPVAPEAAPAAKKKDDA